ncbi:DMT family transporter [Candidatus Woesearchaeota archaeon]|nr:DMT family transporter [Candidatus Woesearchaeota archaeon]
MSAVFLSFADVFKKKILFKEHAMEFSTVLAIFSFVIVLFFIPFVNFNINRNILGLIYVVSIISTAGLLLMNKAIRHLEISTVEPLMNFSPAFLVIFAYFLLGEKLGAWQLGGIGLLIFGAYILEMDHNLKDFLSPFKKLLTSKYLFYILLVIIMYSFSAILDKMILTSIDKFSYVFFVFGFRAINFIFLISIFYDGAKGIKHGVKNAGFPIAVVALLLLFSLMSYYSAVSIAFVSLVIPIKRLSTLFSTVIGGELFHDHSLKYKITACLVMIVGAGLVALK